MTVAPATILPESLTTFPWMTSACWAEALVVKPAAAAITRIKRRWDIDLRRRGNWRYELRHEGVTERSPKHVSAAAGESLVRAGILLASPHHYCREDFRCVAFTPRSSLLPLPFFPRSRPPRVARLRRA